MRSTFRWRRAAFAASAAVAIVVGCSTQEQSVGAEPTSVVVEVTQVELGDNDIVAVDSVPPEAPDLAKIVVATANADALYFTTVFDSIVDRDDESHVGFLLPDTPLGYSLRETLGQESRLWVDGEYFFVADAEPTSTLRPTLGGVGPFLALSDDAALSLADVLFAELATEGGFAVDGLVEVDGVNVLRLTGSRPSPPTAVADIEVLIDGDNRLVRLTITRILPERTNYEELFVSVRQVDVRYPVARPQIPPRPPFPGIEGATPQDNRLADISVERIASSTSDQPVISFSLSLALSSDGHEFETTGFYDAAARVGFSETILTDPDGEPFSLTDPGGEPDPPLLSWYEDGEHYTPRDEDDPTGPTRPAYGEIGSLFGMSALSESPYEALLHELRSNAYFAAGTTVIDQREVRHFIGVRLVASSEEAIEIWIDDDDRLVQMATPIRQWSFEFPDVAPAPPPRG